MLRIQSVSIERHFPVENRSEIPAWFQKWADLGFHESAVIVDHRHPLHYRAFVWHPVDRDISSEVS